MKTIDKIIWISLLFFSVLVQTVCVSAENKHLLDNVEIKVSFPYHQDLHPHELNWTIVQIEISNHAEEKLEGTVQVYSNQDNLREAMVVEQEVQVGSATEELLTLTVPTNMFQKKALIRLVTEDQQEAVVEWENPLMNQAYTQLTIVSEQENDFHFLKSIENDYTRFPTSRMITPGKLPEDFWAFHEKIIALGNLGQAQLTPEQIKALETWVKSGGVLILSGGEDFLPYADSFASLLPIQRPSVKQHTSITKASEDKTLLSQLGLAELPELPTILVGEPKPHALFYPHEGYPLFASWQLGKGVVILATYDVSSEPLASWQGNKQMWNDVLEKFGALYTLHKKESHSGEVFRLNHFSEQIPNLTGPSIGMITVIWMIYLVIIGPLLYLILKKADKREWAWVIIPCLVVLTSVSVYGLGLQRIASKTNSHLVSTIQIFDPEAARIDSSANFFVLEGNNFTVNIAENMQAIALAKRNHSNTVQSYLHIGNGQRYLRYENVPYMSLAQAKAMGLANDVGYVEHELKVEDGRITGWLINRTKLDLERAELQFGQQIYELGQLPQNERIDINMPLAKFYFNKYTYEDIYSVNKSYYEARLNRSNHPTPSSYTPSRPKLDLYALSHTPISVLHMDGEETTEHYTHMVWQELTMGTEAGGKGMYPYGALPVYMGHGDHLRGEYYYHDSILTSGSSVPIEFQVKPFSLHVEKVQIPLNEVVFSPFKIKIWNVHTREWEQVEQNQMLELKEAELSKYVTPRGVLTLLFENHRQESFQLPYPYVQVEGEWKS